MIFGKRYRILFLAMFIMGIMSRSLMAQNVCLEKLSTAENSFETGHLYEIYDLIAECLENGFSREDKIRAYRLLSITYLYLDEHEKAEESYLSLLRLNPEYKPNTLIDPTELFHLHHKFLTSPRWSILMIKVGGDLSFVKPYNLYNTDGVGYNYFAIQDNIENKKAKEYLPAAGFFLGAGVKYGLSHTFSFTGELLFKLNRFKVRDNILGHTTLQFNEDQYNLEIPVLFNMCLSNSKWKPYVFGGGSLNFMVHSAAKNLVIERTQGATVLPETGPSVSLISNRNRFGYSVIVGGGVHYKVGVNYLLLEIRHTFGLKSISSTNNRFDNDEMLYKYMYIDDDMRLNNLMFSISYLKPLYNPRRKVKR